MTNALCALVGRLLYRGRKVKDEQRTVVAVNNSKLAISVWLNEGGPFGEEITPGSHSTLDITHMTLTAVKWTATHTHRGCSYSICSGVLSRDLRVGCWQPIVVPSIDLSPLIRVVDVQQRWRAKLRQRKVALAAARRRSAVSIQRFSRGKLVRKLSRCLICLDDVPWRALVSTVPSARCHRTCRACARAYTDSAIADGKLYVRCPGECCTHLLDPELFASAGSKRTYRENLRANHAKRLEGESDPSFLAFCKEHARSCPACGVLIWRYAGCDHMSCRCGHRFNWNEAAARVGHPDAIERPNPPLALAVPPPLDAHGAERGFIDIARVVAEQDFVDGDTEEPVAAEPVAAGEEIRRLPGNEHCFDCGASPAAWASVSFGCTLCVQCAGAHRQLGVHLSFVRSLTLDALPMADAMLLRLSGGNTALRAYLASRQVEWEAMVLDDKRRWYASSQQSATYRSHLRSLRDMLRDDLTSDLPE